MSRFMVMAVAAALLAAGGYGAERDTAKEAPIDWPARAATVEQLRHIGLNPEDYKP